MLNNSVRKKSIIGGEMKKSLRALGALVGALALATISFAPANAEEALADDTA